MNDAQAASEVYRQRMYNFLTDNCHCFVAHFLNSVAYGGITELEHHPRGK